MDASQKFLLSASSLEQQIFSVPKNRGKGAVTYLNVNFLPHLIFFIKEKHLSREEVASLNNYHLQTYVMEKSTMKFKYSSLKQLIDLLVFDMESMEEFWLPNTKKRSEVLQKRLQAENDQIFEEKIEDKTGFPPENPAVNFEKIHRNFKEEKAGDFEEKVQFFKGKEENEIQELKEKPAIQKEAYLGRNTFAVIAEESKEAFSCYSEYASKCRGYRFFGMERLSPENQKNYSEENEGKAIKNQKLIFEENTDYCEKKARNSQQIKENNEKCENSEALKDPKEPKCFQEFIKKEIFVEKWIAPVIEGNYLEAREEIMRLRERIRRNKMELSQLNHCTDSAEFREKIMTRKQEGAQNGLMESKWLQLIFFCPEYLSRAFRLDLSFFERINYQRNLGVNLQAFKTFKVSQWLPNAIFNFFFLSEPFKTRIASFKKADVLEHLFQNFLLFICTSPGVLAPLKSKNLKKTKEALDPEESLSKIEKDFSSVISRKFCLFCLENLQINLKGSLSLKKSKKANQIKFIQNALLAARCYLFQNLKEPKEYYALKKTRGLIEEKNKGKKDQKTRNGLKNAMESTSLGIMEEKSPEDLPKIAKQLIFLSKLEDPSISLDQISGFVSTFRHFFDSFFWKSDYCQNQLKIIKRIQMDLVPIQSIPNEIEIQKTRKIFQSKKVQEIRLKILKEACWAFKKDLEILNGATGSIARKVTDFSMWNPNTLKRFLEGLLKYFHVFINNKKITDFIGEPHQIIRTHDVKRLKNKYLRFARKRWVDLTGDNGFSGVINILKQDVASFKKEEAFPWIFGHGAAMEEEPVQESESEE